MVPGIIRQVMISLNLYTQLKIQKPLKADVGEGDKETRDRYLQLGLGYSGSAKMNAAAQATFQREVQDLAKPTFTTQQYVDKPLPGIPAFNTNTNTKKIK